MTIRAVPINRTTSPPTAILVIIIPLDILGEMSPADEVGSRVWKLPVTLDSVGAISVTVLDLSGAGVNILEEQLLD